VGTRICSLTTGTPCQIGGLKSYLGKFHDNLICMDIVCHGVPSPEVWKKYIKYREEKAGVSTQRIVFRLKEEGSKQYSVSFLFKNNTEYRKTRDKDLYMKVFLKNVCLRPSCYECEFKSIHRESDITLADFWGIQKVLPEMDDGKGTSLIFVNSIIGQNMFEQIKDKILFEKVDINEAVKYNSMAIKSVEYNQKRIGFFKDLNNYSFDILAKKYCTDKLLLRLKKKVKCLVRGILTKTGLLRVTKVFLGK
jgi:hypothetical protein